MSTWKSSLVNIAWLPVACVNGFLSLAVLGNSLKAYRAYSESSVVTYPSGFWWLVFSVCLLSALTAYFVLQTEKEINRLGMIFLASVGPVGIAAFSLYRLYDHVGSF